MAEATESLDRWLYAIALGTLIGGAWLALGLLGASAYAPYISHSAPVGSSASEAGARLVAFVAGWAVMSVAMMLPSSLPLVTVFRTITAGAPGLLSCLVAGYLAIWTLFGAVALLGDTALHALVESLPALQARAHLIPAVVLLTAGLFQFSPLKHSCLEQCRSPIGFVVEHWRGGSRARQAFRLGLRHGVFCVGCCWALMVLMFAVGGIHLGWMLALGAVMFVEKVAAWGRWITAPVGALLTLWGLALLASVPGIPRPF